MTVKDENKTSLKQTGPMEDKPMATLPEQTGPMEDKPMAILPEPSRLHVQSNSFMQTFL